MQTGINMCDSYLRWLALQSKAIITRRTRDTALLQIGAHVHKVKRQLERLDLVEYPGH
jgi:hypothetical protein